MYKTDHSIPNVYLGQMSMLLACNTTCNAKWYLLERALVENYL
jgi:hypothetical protein